MIPVAGCQARVCRRATPRQSAYLGVVGEREGQADAPRSAPVLTRSRCPCPEYTPRPAAPSRSPPWPEATPGAAHGGGDTCRSSTPRPSETVASGRHPHRNAAGGSGSQTRAAGPPVARPSRRGTIPGSAPDPPLPHSTRPGPSLAQVLGAAKPPAFCRTFDTTRTRVSATPRAQPYRHGRTRRAQRRRGTQEAVGCVSFTAATPRKL